MELEQRVKVLEYELKILKNEIQRTLLDIQEQVLVHYYPSLRAEETKPSDGTIQAYAALKARQPAPASPKSIPVAPSDNPAPPIKPVTLDEIRNAQNEIAAEPAAQDEPSAQNMFEALVNKAGSLEQALKLLDEAKRG